MTVRTRFAPSPTGYLHVGGARTALFNWLFARASSGSFIIRIEDTDRVRSKRVYEDAIVEDLKWLGLAWDEGPDVGGPNGPYRQSERGPVYIDYARKLVSEGLAYRCYCTKKRLQELKLEQLKAGLPPRYDGKCRDLKKPPEGVRPVTRFEVHAGGVEFTDLVHGPVSIDPFKAGGDFIILDSEESPSYNFSVVVDDALMGITHVIRGDDHLPNTPMQILLIGTTLRALKQEGYLAEAVLNAASRLGWSPGAGFLGLEEMVKGFKPERVKKSPSVFDMERLKGFNKEALTRVDTERLVTVVGPHLEGVDRGWLAAAVRAVKGNCTTVNDIPELLAPFVEYELTDEAKSFLSEPHAPGLLKALLEEVENVERLDGAVYRDVIERLKKRTGETGKRLLMPVRAAITGRTTGVELEKVFTLLGKEKILERLKSCLK
jgi:glutamyl-tRNA synthetase/nondiscriminating glutamyl-tRNA synthetase